MTKKLNKTLVLVCSLFFLLSIVFFAGIKGMAYAEPTVEFKMIDGAFIRTAEPYGIQFRSTVPEEIATNSDNSFYMLIIPADYMETYSLTLGDDYYGVLSTAVGASNLAVMPCLAYLENNIYYLRGSLVGVKYANLNRGFIGITYYENNGVRYYAELSDDYIRSICNVAIRYMNSVEYGNDDDVDEFIDDLIVDAYDSARNNEKGTTADLNAVKAGITLNYDSVILMNNSNNDLKVSLDCPIDIDISWSSDDTSVAMVSDGNLSAVGGGETTINVDYGIDSKAISTTVIDVPSSFTNVYIDPVFTEQNIGYYGYYAGNTSLTYDVANGAYLHEVMLPYNETTNLVSIDTDIIKAALEDGLTTLSVDVKLLAADGYDSSVSLKWRSNGAVTNNSSATTVTTESWVTMSIDPTTLGHWQDASLKAFVINGNGSVTVNCSSFGISSSNNSGKYQVLFRNLRAGEAIGTTGGIYMNTADVSGSKFGREKIAFYSTGELVIADGTTATTYNYKYYQNGYYKLCSDDSDERLSAIKGTLLNLSDYTALTFTSGFSTVSFYDSYAQGEQPITNIRINNYSEAAARLVLPNEILDLAFAEGYTTVHISAKSNTTDAINLVLGGTGLWAQQKRGITAINNESFSEFSIDLKNQKNNANPAVYCATDPEEDGCYQRNWNEIGISEDYQTLIVTDIYYIDFYFSK